MFYSHSDLFPNLLLFPVRSSHYSRFPSLPFLQWWMGRPLWGCGGVWARSRGRDHDEAAVRGGQVLWRLLPEAAAGHQHQEPLVLRVLAVPLPVPAAGSPTGEQELQESLFRWVTIEISCHALNHHPIFFHLAVSKSGGLNLTCVQNWITITNTVYFYSLFFPPWIFPPFALKKVITVNWVLDLLALYITIQNHSQQI